MRVPFNGKDQNSDRIRKSKSFQCLEIELFDMHSSAEICSLVFDLICVQELALKLHHTFLQSGWLHLQRRKKLTSQES